MTRFGFAVKIGVCIALSSWMVGCTVSRTWRSASASWSTSPARRSHRQSHQWSTRGPRRGERGTLDRTGCREDSPHSSVLRTFRR